jgi:type I restriction enzyme S subunit
MKTTWQTKKLGEVIKLEYGKPLPKSKRDDRGKYPVYGANGVKTRSDASYFDQPSIIVGRKGSAGELNLTEGRFWPLDVTYYVTFDNSKFDRDFLYQLLGSLELTRLAKGVKPGLNRNEVYSIDVTTPPLSEQKQIVKLLNEAFEKVTKAQENAKENLQNSKDLFKSFLQSVFANPRKGWEEKKLGDVCEVIGGGTPSKAKVKFYDGDIPWATVRDMKFEIIKETEHKITADAVKNSSTNIIPKRNVIIATRVGLGKVCLIENDTAINQDLRAIVPKSPKELMVGYLFQWLKSVAHIIKEEGTGATVQGVKLPFIKALRIQIPSLAEQKAIVKKLETLSTKTEKLETLYTQKLTDLEELKRSLLKQAFSGELVTESPAQVVQVAVPSPYFRNQVHAAIVEQVVKDGGSTTEVAVAKYDHLLQEVCGMTLGYQFQTHQFGPFDAQIKRLISSGLGRNRWFTKRNGMIVFGQNVNALLSRKSNLYYSAQASMKELSRLGVTKLDAERVELLSTVCHSIRETGSTTLNLVREFMSLWQTDGNRTKADKFTPEQTQKCLDFILKNNLQQAFTRKL